MDLDKIEYSKLDPELVKKLEEVESRTPASQQLLALRDVADITHELLNVLDSIKEQGSDSQNKLGAVLVDMREHLQAIKDREEPETPDYAKPVVQALEKAEKSLSEAFKKIDVKPEFKPNIKVSAPEVKVSAPNVDLKGVEKVLKTDLPKAFDKAIKSIPKADVPDTDFTPVIDKLEDLREWLESIDSTSRIKPTFPSTMKVTNPDGTAIKITYNDFRFDPNDDTPTYIGKNLVNNASTAGTDWILYKFTYSGSNVTRIQKTTNSWDGRAGAF